MFLWLLVGTVIAATDMPVDDWPAALDPLKAMMPGGCGPALISTAAGMSITCTTDLATSAVTAVAPDATGILCDYCPATCAADGQTCPEPPAPDVPADEWPVALDPLKAMLPGGCGPDLIVTAAGMSITCSTDLATSAVTAVAPDATGTLCDYCATTCAADGQVCGEGPAEDLPTDQWPEALAPLKAMLPDGCGPALLGTATGMAITCTTDLATSAVTAVAPLATGSLCDYCPATCAEDGQSCAEETGPVAPPVSKDPTCTDRKKNGNEEGIDCGGPDCPVCGGSCKCHYPGGKCNEDTGVCTCNKGYSGEKCHIYGMYPEYCKETCKDGVCAPCEACKTYATGAIAQCAPCEEIGYSGLLDPGFACHADQNEDGTYPFMTCDDCYNRVVPSYVWDGVPMTQETKSFFEQWPSNYDPKAKGLNEFNVDGKNCFEDLLAEGVDLCESLAIGCKDGLATEIDCRNTWIDGDLPDFTIFPDLQYLALTNNHFRGQLPDFAKIPKLKYIDIDSNKLTGPIPSSLGDLEFLEHIDFDFNKFSGNFPSNLHQLTKLKVLQAEHCGLTGPLPPLPDAKKLLLIMLGNNKISGPFPDFSLSQPDLAVLMLGPNLFDGEFPNFLGLPSLGVLDFHGNPNAKGPIRPELLPTEALYSFEAGESGWSGQIPDFSNHTKLEIIDLEKSHLTGTVPTSLQNLKKLEKLLLNSNGLTGTLPDFDLPALEFLVLSDNNFHGPIPNFAGMPKLEKLHLKNNELTGPFPPKGGVPTSVKNVNLAHNMLNAWGDMTPYHFAGLNLSHNNFPMPEGAIFDLPAEVSDVSYMPDYNGVLVVDIKNSGNLMMITGNEFHCPLPEIVGVKASDSIIIVVDECKIPEETLITFTCSCFGGVLLGLIWVWYKKYHPAPTTKTKAVAKKVFKSGIHLFDLVGDTLFFLATTYYLEEAKFNCAAFDQIFLLKGLISDAQHRFAYDLSDSELFKDFHQDLVNLNTAPWPGIVEYYEEGFAYACGMAGSKCTVENLECVNVPAHQIFLTMVYLAYSVSIFKELVKVGAILVTFVLNRLHPCLQGSPGVLLNSVISPLIFLRNPALMWKILQKPATKTGVITEFLFEGILENVPQFAMAIYFSLNVAGTGVSDGVFVSMIMQYISIMIIFVQFMLVVVSKPKITPLPAGKEGKLEGAECNNSIEDPTDNTETSTSPRQGKKRGLVGTIMSTVFSP